MEIFEALTLIVLGILFIPFCFVSFKGTVLEFSYRKRNLWPLWFYYEAIGLIILSVLIVYFVRVEHIAIFYRVKNNIEFNVAILTFYTMYVFIVTLSISLRFFFKKGSENFKEIVLKSDLSKLTSFASAVLLTIFLLYFYAILFANYKHALLASLLERSSLIQVRLHNVYASKLPSQLTYLFFLGAYILSIHGGILVSRKSILKGLFYFFCGLFFASAQGDKAPIIIVLVNFIITMLVFNKKPLNLFKLIITFALIFIVGISILYVVVSFQIPNLNFVNFWIYLYNRLGIGQMEGVYETFSLDEIPEGRYYLHMIPFASLFTHYTNFQKILMMVTEGYDYASMGVKNSLFIAEAYAIGGWGLTLISPIIVGITYGLGLFVFFKGLKFLFGDDVARVYFLPLYLLTHQLTGGFSGFPLLKRVIHILLLLTSVWVIRRLLQIMEHLIHSINVPKVLMKK